MNDVQTTLSLAAEKGHDTTVHMLLELKANVSTEDSEGKVRLPSSATEDSVVLSFVVLLLVAVSTCPFPDRVDSGA